MAVKAKKPRVWEIFRKPETGKSIEKPGILNEFTKNLEFNIILNVNF